MTDQEAAAGKTVEAKDDPGNGIDAKDERPEDLAKPDPEGKVEEPEAGPDKIEDPICEIFDGLTAMDLEAGFREDFGDPSEIEAAPDPRRAQAERMRYAIVAQAVGFMRQTGVDMIAKGKGRDVSDFLVPRLGAPIVIRDDEAAGFIVGVVQHYEQIAAQIQSQAKALAGDALKRRDFILKIFEPALRDHLQRHIDGQTTKKKTKSIKLMTGMSPDPAVLKMTGTKERLIVDDADEFVGWVAEGVKSLLSDFKWAPCSHCEGTKVNPEPKRPDDPVACPVCEGSKVPGHTRHDKTDAEIEADAEQAEELAKLVVVVPEQRKPDVRALNAYWKKTGEVPPGCDHVPADQSFSIKR
jgi:hypothetical protein